MITATTAYDVHTLWFDGEPVAHTSHKELADAMQRAATAAVDVAQASVESPASGYWEHASLV